MSTITNKEWKDLEKDLIAAGGNLPGIYKITRKSDGKVYIGQSVCIVDRIKQHINNVREGDSAKIDGAIQAEGWNSFKYEVEEAIPDATTVQLWYREATLINKYNSCINGFNKTRGNHVNAVFNSITTKHEVSVELTKEIRDQFKLSFFGKRVLLIGFFKTQFIDKLKYDDCEVIQVSKVFENREDFGKYILEELKKDYIMNTKFDLIIANPPYGKTGANITKAIIDNVDYVEYINLLPANDYKRNDTKDLFKYVDLDTMKHVNNGFADAAVTTHIARINKKPHRYLSWEEFQIENYIDDSLTKYFYELKNKDHYAIDNSVYKPKLQDFDKVFDLKRCLFIGKRYASDKHLPYTKNCAGYKVNVERNITTADLIAISAKSEQANGNVGDFSLVQFATEAEQNNIVQFLYSTDGFRFFAKILVALNVDSYCSVDRFLPKVDWTRTWTVEEILADYGYTQSEIDEVMADLVNFKGMED